MELIIAMAAFGLACGALIMAVLSYITVRKQYNRICGKK